MAQVEILERGATFSADNVYRYDLYRRIRSERDWTITFVLLNPSTADAFQEDPTVRRCLGYAARWRYEHVWVVNLFALRSTDPKRLREVIDPVGPGNDEAIREAVADAHLTILGWGTHGANLNRSVKVRAMLMVTRHARRIFCLRKTKDGHPAHPLYLPGDLLPQRL